MIGLSPFDIAHPSDHDALRRRNDLLKQAAVRSRIRKANPAKDGRTVPIFSVATPITGYGDQATLVAITDLTERERALQLLSSVPPQCRRCHPYN